MPSWYLLVFISQSNCPFVERIVKNDFYHVHHIYLYGRKLKKHASCYLGMLLSFPYHETL